MRNLNNARWRTWLTVVAVAMSLALSQNGRVNAQQAAPNELRIFHLKHVPASEAGETIAQVLQAGENMRVAVDARTNALVVSSSADLLREIEALLMQLDQQSAINEAIDATLPPVTVRVIWLGSNVQGKPVPKGLEPVIAELQTFGIEDLSLVGQSIINVGDASKPFSTDCRPQIGDMDYQMRFQGVRKAVERGVPAISVQIDARDAALDESLANISTIVEAPLNQYIVLGTTVANGWDSVFVLQLTPRATSAVKK